MDLLHISPLRLLSTDSYDTTIFDEKEDVSSLSSYFEHKIESNRCSPAITRKSSQNGDNLPQIRDIESQTSEKETKRIYMNKIALLKKQRSSFDSIFGTALALHRTKYKQKVAVHYFLTRPRGLAIGYHLFVSCVVFICLVLNILSTTGDYEMAASNGLKVMDILVVLIFGGEFIARLWSSACLINYRGFYGKLRFLFNPFRICDIFIITTSTIVLFFDIKGQILSTFLKGFRFFQVFGMFRLEHRFKPWRLMGSVIWNQREHLSITAYMGFLSLLFVSFIVYFAEKDVNPDFSSLADSLWWGVVTLCTVGYGEITPITPIGKFLSCFGIIIGVSLFALPSGILGAGLALKVEEQQHKRQITKRRQPAANLIQSSWRFYSVNKQSASLWKRHLIPNTKLNFLTNRQKNAIKFIIIIKFLVMKRRFNTSFKPYDIKDVLEQYAAGHADVSARVKYILCRVNCVQSVVNTNLKTLFDTKVMISSQLSKIESNVYDLQLRLNQLIERQVKDNNTNNATTLLSDDKKNSQLFEYSTLRRKSY